MKNQSFACRHPLDIGPASPEPVPVHNAADPAHVESWTLDVESSEFTKVHTVAITHRTRRTLRRSHALTLPTLTLWAKALRQEATRHHSEVGAEVGW